MQRFSILTMVMLMLGTMGVEAATHIVRSDGSGDFTSVQGAAIGAGVIPGDTILIDDSALYTETSAVAINQPLTIIASPGMTPTIANGQGGNITLWIREGGGGTQFGSISGGTITLDGLNTATDIIRAQHDAPTELILENLSLINPSSALSGSCINQFSTAPEMVGSTTVRKVVMDRNLARGQAIKLSNTKRESIIRFEDCSLINPPVGDGAGNGITVSGQTTGQDEGGTLIIDSCLFDTGAKGISFEAGRTDHAGILWNMTITDTCLRATGTSNSVGIVNSLESHITLTNTAIVSAFACLVSQTFTAAPTGDDSDSTYVIDHCDLITTEGQNDACIKFFEATGRELHLSNSNLLNQFPMSTFETVLFDVPTTEVMTSTNNNLVSDGPKYRNFNGTPVNEVDPPITPDYNDIAACDFTYENATLLVSDENGEPVGTNQILPPVEMDVQAWQLY